MPRLPLLLFCGFLMPAAVCADNLELWNLHGQTTLIPQAHAPFHSPYSGPNSLANDFDAQMTFTATVFSGLRLWHGAALYFDPEATAGSGMSGGLGLAGVPNDEGARVGTRALRIAMARLFIRQTIGFGGTTTPLEDSANQLAFVQDSRRVTLTFGKLSATDIFDNNQYSHDPRMQFMNWGLTTNAAWDYPADTRGYTWGAATEFTWDAWSWRGGGFLEPQEANGSHLEDDPTKENGEVTELEHDHEISGHPGAVRLLAFWNNADMGHYRTALNLSPINPDITQTRETGSRKYGFGFNAEQEITTVLGGFMRLGWDDGHTETWAFDEVDRTASAGAVLKGRKWNRLNDNVGLAALVNALSPDHRAYLAAGGDGFLLGDGHLNYGTENILETYYAARIINHLTLTFDFQEIFHPGYNIDRGPVSVGAVRLHLEF